VTDALAGAVVGASAGAPGVASADAGLVRRAEVDQLRLFLAHWRGSLVAIGLGTATAAVAWGAWIPLPLRLAWCLLAGANYLAQAVVCWQLDRAPVLADALPRRLPWLVATVAGSGLVWGAVPWMLQAAPTTTTPVLLFAGMFNMLLVFSVVNAPCNRAMVVAAVLPVAVLTASALLGWPGLLPVGLGCLLLCLLILLYGLRVQAAMQATMVERHRAHDLADTLAHQQQRLVALEGERRVLLERQRLMRDLHDGLGATLTSSLLAVEQGGADAGETARLLRECMDDLRAVVDSLESDEHDVVALLAALRFRVGPRLQRLGMQLDWDVQDLPPLPWLGPTEALQVLRLVQEALSNSARHAGAQRLRLATRARASAVEVRLRDDGRGFDTRHAPPGRGLRFMAQRAALLGARLQIVSAPGRGTLVRLRLPLHRPGPGGACGSA